MRKQFHLALMFGLASFAASAIDITVEGKFDFSLTGNQDGAGTELFMVYVPDGHRAEVKVTGRYTSFNTLSETARLFHGESILGGFDSTAEKSYDIPAFKERGSFSLFVSASPDYYNTNTSQGLKPYSHYSCRLSYVVSVKFVPLSDYYSGSLQAKAVVEDSGATLRFVCDDVDYSAKGKTWCLVAAAEAQSPDMLPPWRGIRATITKVVFDASFKTHRPKHCGHWFDNFEALTMVMGLENLDTSAATSLTHMFSQCSSLESLDVSTFNTVNVKEMGHMFWHCEKLTSLNLSSFNTANVTNMTQMFEACKELTSLNLSSFNTAKVISMESMFALCSALRSVDLSSFNTTKVISMGSMFALCSALRSVDLSSFNTMKVRDMGQMFSFCSSLESVDLSSFDTSNVISMSAMFWCCRALPSLDLSSFDTSNVENMGRMFNGCHALKKIYTTERFVTFQAKGYTDVFAGCDALVGGWGTAYNEANPTGKTYAHIDGGSSSDRPGYFTYKAPLPSGSYGIRFLSDGGMGDMDCMICKSSGVDRLRKCAFTKEGKSFKGWLCSNGRRYDDQILVFGLAPVGMWIEMRAVWE